MTEDEEEMIQDMLKLKVERSNCPDTYVPFDEREYQANNDLPLPLMKTLFVEGNEEKFQCLKRRCKTEKVDQKGTNQSID